MRRPLLSSLVLMMTVAFAACGGGDDDPVTPDAGETPDAEVPDGSPYDCGNGEIEPGEDCEQGDLGGQDCVSIGFDRGTLFCNLDCSFDTALCESDTCGNGMIDGEDLCDGTDVGAATCETEGFQPGGTLTCNETCDGYVTTACVPLSCGDGDIDAGEVCDGAALGGQSCVSRGFARGDLACGTTCQAFDTTDCEPSVCGNNMVETGEDCDDGDMIADEFCTADCQSTGAVTVTTCQTLAPLPSGTCEVTAGSAAKLITGDILTPGEILVGGQVYVDTAGVIQCTGCDCSAMAAGATQITCPTGVVSPGLINTHDHLTFTQNDPYTQSDERYEHRHQWRRGQNGHTEINASGGATTPQMRWGELRFVMGGATSTASAGSATGLLRNLDSNNQEGLGQSVVETPTFPLDDGSSGTRRTGDCDYGGTPDTASVFASTDAYEPHVSEGIDQSARNEFLCMSSSTYDTTAPDVSHDLTTAESAFIHSTGLRAVDYAQMGLDGTSLIWSPRSNVTLYGDTAQVTTAAALGVRIALGTDWTATGSMNMLRELACADELNQTYYDGYFTDEDLWLMATYSAAQAMAMDDAIGRLAPGLVADIAIFNGAVNTRHRAVLEAQAEDVVLVLRGGKPLYGDATVVDGATADTCDVVDVCGVSKQVCVMSEIGQSYAAFAAANSSLYPAFFCEVPDNEPSCHPERTRTTAPMASVNGSTVYDGVPTVDDTDGDGIANATDNCPGVFNPVRPLDNGVQADHDADGEGDVCDVCPLDADSTACTPPNPDDIDGDGVLGAMDNCPGEANPGQEDADDDDKGDVCDACPMDSNPGTTACPGTIYEVKDGTLPAGTAVQITGAIVTGRFADGFFLQVKPGDAGYLGADHSGVYVYAPGNTVAEGDRVTISATLQDYFGQLQLSNATSIAVTSSGEALPAPIAVAVADVVTGGTRAAALEGVLVTVSDVTVTSLDTPFNEFLVNTTPPGASALRVDDLLYLPAPFPAVSDYFTSITGLLNFRNSNSKLEPRRAADLVEGLTLASFGPALSYVTEGQMGAATVPTALTVTMNTPVAADTFVPITSSNEAALTVVGGGVTIPAGQTSATVLVNGLAQAASVTLTASYDGTMLTAAVRVLGAAELPSTVTLTPATANLAVGGTLTMTVTLDVPAPVAGTVVSVTLNPATAGAVPPTVVIPSGQLSATFDYVDASMVSSVDVTATLGASSDTTTITLVDSTSDHLVINEIDYDQIDADTGEYIEIYNGTGAPVSLAGALLIMVNGNGGGAAEYARYDLSTAGATLPADGYLLVKNDAVPANGALTVALPLNGAQNGAPDGVVLVVGGVAVDAIAYEGAMANGSFTGVTGSVVFTTVNLADTNTGTESLSRSPNGVDTDAAGDWVLATSGTPGTANP